ncbi:MAG TPA: ABC transporter ATP-binding protein [Ktedonobacteraceae bacterium]|nr:ABC transporter ATP-binding protein [Ktedonobacteraceae bacterium]
MRLPLKSYQALLLQYLRPQWRRMLLLFLLLLASVGLQLVNPQILRYFIDTALAGSATAPLLLAGLLFIGIALLNQGSSVWATYVSENIAWTATNTLRTDLIAHCLRLDMAFHKAHTPGELIERIDGDVDTLSNFFSQLTVHLLANTLLLLGVLALLFQIDWRVGLSISAFALLALLVLLRIRGLAVSLWVKDRQMDADFFSFIGEQLVGTEDIRANGATLYVMRRFYLFLRRWLPIHRKASLASYSMGMTTMTLFALGNALSFALGAYLWSQHATSIGTIYLIFYYTNLLTQPLEQIRMQLQDLQRAGAGIERVNGLLHTEPKIQDGIGTQLPEGALSVAFEQVTFNYTGEFSPLARKQEAVLHDLSFTLQEGHVLGVLGRTGSGKTTLARLLLRLYDAQEGMIRVGGVAVQEARLHDLRRHIGMVTQDVQLFHATVRDNLTFFDKSIPDERILAVLDDLGLMGWYRSLPLGLDTELGSDGEGLSAGEAQLLAFTRVFLANPGLVILDEASSRLDPATEQLIERAVSKLLAGRTGIVIAHHLGTIQRADEVLILEHGRMLEHGDRKSLASNAASHFYHLLQTGLEEVHA